MVAIGPSSVFATSLASSAAGSLRADAAADDARVESADQKARNDADLKATQAIGDVSETELSSERDADGRLPWSPASHDAPEATGETDDESPQEPRRYRSQDADGIRGRRLDLDA